MKTNAQLQKDHRRREKYDLVKLYFPRHMIKALTQPHGVLAT